MIILTGGAGFIGSCVLRLLNDQGKDEVLVVDHLGSGLKWRNLVGKRFLDYVHKDQFLEQLLAGAYGEGAEIEAVIHLGACSSTTEADADYLYRNNFKYSQLLAGWCLEKGVRFIYASSAATYGDGQRGFLDEEAGLRRLRPLNMYGYSKQLFDEWALDEGLLGKMVGLKFFNVFGPNEAHKGDMRSLVDKAVGQILETKRLKLFKSHREGIADGEQTRDFIYAKDAAAVVLKLLAAKDVHGLFNLGSGQAHTWNQLAASVFEALGRPLAVDYVDIPPAIRDKYQYHTRAEMGKLRSALGLLPIRSLDDAVKDYVQVHLLKDERW
ncbi:MAG: ADP-glyceromanno-heptose 6-epimerase [bacterium]